jgi:hypothetical protein
MNRALLSYGLLTMAALAKEWKVVIRDEEDRGIAGAQVEAILTPPDDPRLASVAAYAGASDPSGCFRFAADERLVLMRVRAKRQGHHAADADQRHGLGRPTQSAEFTLTLPRKAEQVPLHYREVSLSGLPTGKPVGFDAEAIDAVPPWGKGKVTDFIFRIDSTQVGWTESAETLAYLRRAAEGVRMDEREWAETYGRFSGRLHLSMPRPGDGLRKTPSFWPCTLLKMPAQAPDGGYASEIIIPFETAPSAGPAHDFTGYYLRLRSQRDTAGRIASSHYAKIHGRIGVGPGRVTFRFYYNPRTDDRRLAFAPGRNLLHPSGPDEPAHVFETHQP